MTLKNEWVEKPFQNTRAKKLKNDLFEKYALRVHTYTLGKCFGA